MTAPWMPPLPHHPEPRTMRWTELEIASIRKAQADAARAALEQAAKVCDEKARRNFPWGSENSDIYHAQADWAEHCADAIRALAREVTP